MTGAYQRIKCNYKKVIVSTTPSLILYLSYLIMSHPCPPNLLWSSITKVLRFAQHTDFQNVILSGFLHRHELSMAFRGRWLLVTAGYSSETSLRPAWRWLWLCPTPELVHYQLGLTQHSKTGNGEAHQHGSVWLGVAKSATGKMALESKLQFFPLMSLTGLRTKPMW